jgi:hypothetical protein
VRTPAPTPRLRTPAPTTSPTPGPIICLGISSNAASAGGLLLFDGTVGGLPDDLRLAIAVYDATRSWDAFGTFSAYARPFVGTTTTAYPVVWAFSVAFTEPTGVIRAGDWLTFQFYDATTGTVLGQCSTAAPRAG